MATPQWIKKLGGHAGELYVAAELSKRGIPNSLLPENFSDDDILIGAKDRQDFATFKLRLAIRTDRRLSFSARLTRNGKMQPRTSSSSLFGSVRRRPTNHRGTGSPRSVRLANCVQGMPRSAAITGSAAFPRLTSILCGKKTGMLLQRSSPRSNWQAKV